MNIHINNSTVMLRRSVGTGFYSLAVQNAVCIQRIFFFLLFLCCFFFFFVLTNGKQIIDLDLLQGLGLN